MEHTTLTLHNNSNILKKLVYILLLLPLLAQGQYYNQGQSPASVRWNYIDGTLGKIVHQDSCVNQARQVEQIIQSSLPHVQHGYKHGALKLPILLHAQNFNSNGMVMWAPKRMELITVPSINTHSEPWLKQLITHELRHAVQYSNMSRNTVYGLKFILGQQANLLSTGLIPIWLTEGDAVVAETQLSTFGRGLQPSFTIDYRYFLGENMMDIDRNLTMDKWYSGAYNEQIPSHYHFGYQIASYSYDRYGDDMWNNVVEYSSKYPFFLFTTKFALWKYYRMSSNKLFRATFKDLQQYWATLPREENTAEIVPTKIVCATSYLSPQRINDTTLVAIKSDLDNYSKIVTIDDRSGEERRVIHTGAVSSMPSYSDGKLYWTEYRRSTLWDQQVFSQLVTLDLKSGKSTLSKDKKTVLYPTVVTKDSLALVNYDLRGYYSIELGSKSLVLPDTLSVHGLAYDNLTQKLYFIGLSDQGMGIYSTSKELTGMQTVTRAAHISINNLSAEEGRLFFSSIASGKDEAHMYDIESATEYQLTTSTYGSFAPKPSGDSVILTTYAKNSYLVSKQKIDTSKRICPSPLPLNVVNPPRKRWDIFNIDTVKIEISDSSKVKRYRKGLNLFNIHSWAPAYFVPNEILENVLDANFNFGATVLSQNLLGSMNAAAGYQYNENGNLFDVRMSYNGLPVKMDFDFRFGGSKQRYIANEEIPLPEKLSNYYGYTFLAYTPIWLSTGYNMRSITPSLQYSHDNTLVTNNNHTEYHSGLDILYAALNYSQYVRTAPKNILPKWGYRVKVGYLFNPASSNFGQQWSSYALGYLPGVSSNHSIKLQGAYEVQKSNTYNFSPRSVLLNGIIGGSIMASQYLCMKADYQMPIWYPNGGIPSILHFKRVRLNMSYGYMKYQMIRNNKSASATSWGGDLMIDFAAFRLPSTHNATVTISVYQPSRDKKLFIGTSFSIPL